MDRCDPAYSRAVPSVGSRPRTTGIVQDFGAVEIVSSHRTDSAALGIDSALDESRRGRCVGTSETLQRHDSET